MIVARPPRRWRADPPARTTAEAIARNIWNTLTAAQQESIGIQTLFRKFCNQVPCSSCKDFGICAHRDRRRALAMVIPPDEPITATRGRVRETVRERVWRVQ